MSPTLRHLQIYKFRYLEILKYNQVLEYFLKKLRLLRLENQPAKKRLQIK
jgi:hypothetical protein